MTVKAVAQKPVIVKWQVQREDFTMCHLWIKRLVKSCGCIFFQVSVLLRKPTPFCVLEFTVLLLQCKCTWTCSVEILMMWAEEMRMEMLIKGVLILLACKMAYLHCIITLSVCRSEWNMRWQCENEVSSAAGSGISAASAVQVFILGVGLPEVH